MVVHDIDRPDVGGVQPKMIQIAELARTELTGIVPVLRISTDDNLHSAVDIFGSFDAKETWINGIVENSRYFRLMLSPPGRYYNEGDKISAEMISCGRKLKWRKYTSTPQKVIAKIQEFFLNSKNPTD